MGVTRQSRVLLVGWEGADWRIAQRLLDRGEMRVLADMVAHGACGPLRSLPPYWSTPTWTTLATGAPAHSHEVLTNMEPDGSGDVRPVGSSSRRRPALWNMLSQTGRRSCVIGFPATYPAEAIGGIVVSDCWLQPAGDAQRLWPPGAASVFPTTAIDEISALRIEPGDVTVDELRPFLPRIDDAKSAQGHGAAALPWMLARCATTHNVATYFAPRDDWDFLAVRYDMLAPLGHEFATYLPRRTDAASSPEAEICQFVVEAAYCYHDMMLGRLIELAGDDLTVILVSNHGFTFRPTVLRTDTRHRNTQRHSPLETINPVRRHRPIGMLAAAGRNVARGVSINDASLVDIVPTILALFGAKAAGLSGRVLSEVFTSPLVVDEVAEQLGGESGVPSPELCPDVWLAHELASQMAGVGCLKFDSQSAAAAEHTVRSRLFHRGQSLAAAGQNDAASEVYRELCRRDPAIYPRLHLAECLLELRRLEEAFPVIDEIEQLAPDTLMTRVLRGRWLSDNGRHLDAMELLARAALDGNQFPEVAYQAGIVASRLERWAEARAYFANALRLDEDHRGARRALSAVDRQLSNGGAGELKAATGLANPQVIRKA